MQTLSIHCTFSFLPCNIYTDRIGNHKSFLGAIKLSHSGFPTARSKWFWEAGLGSPRVDCRQCPQLLSTLPHGRCLSSYHAGQLYSVAPCDWLVILLWQSLFLYDGWVDDWLVVGHISPWAVCLHPYLIFVIFFTLADFKA